MDLLNKKFASGMQNPPGSEPSDHNRIGLLLSRDLIFTTKITTTALDLGCQITVISDVAEAISEIRSKRPRLVLIDLMAGELCAPFRLREYVALAGEKAWLVAFGPHIETETLARAKSEGCGVVLPRSKFAGDLPNLLQFYFTHLPGERSANR